MAQTPRQSAGDPNSYQRNYAARIIVLSAAVELLLAQQLQSLSAKNRTAFTESLAHRIHDLIDELTNSAPVPAAFEKALADMKEHAPQIAADLVKHAVAGE